MGNCCCRHANAIVDEYRGGGGSLAACVGGGGQEDGNESRFRVLSLDGLTPDGDAMSLHATKKKPWETPDDPKSRTDSPKGASTSTPVDAINGDIVNESDNPLNNTQKSEDLQNQEDSQRTDELNKTGDLHGTLQKDSLSRLKQEAKEPPVRRSVKDFIFQTLGISKADAGTTMGTQMDASMRKSAVKENRWLGNRTMRESREVRSSRLGQGQETANSMELKGRLGTADNALDGYDEDDDEMAEVASSSAVKVAVMVRPLLDFETRKDAKTKDIVMLVPPCKIKLPKKPTGSAEDGYNFDFDRVYRADNPQAGKQMFAQLVLPVVERFCQGFNGTVLAYGQTGSGKTYTMVIPRAINVLFNYVQLASQKYDLTLKATYYEIYNEQLFDLLSDDQTKTKESKLEIREKPNGEVFVEGVTEIVVNSKEEVAAIIDVGNSRRATAAHKMNAESSRSHAIFDLVLEQRAKLPPPPSTLTPRFPPLQDECREQMNAESSRSHAIFGLVLEQRAKLDAVAAVPEDLQYLRSKLSLVDLAGSERVRDTGTTGDRFSEGININRGLLELGNVINALTEGKKQRHVPYRNSKLTRVLQDSLGGNSETLFLACVSPADTNHDHTINTLRYASRARNIRNNLRLNNKLSLEEEVEYLRNLVLKLQLENAKLKTENTELKDGPDLTPYPGDANEALTL
eukprot:gene20233-26985_t